MKILRVFILLSTVSLVLSCTEDEAKEVNVSPEVVNPMMDVTYDQGFQFATIDLSDVFSDEDGDNLTFTASSSNSAVVTVAVSGTTLTITEVNTGNATVTVTANDGNGGASSDSFLVGVMEAQNTAPTLTSTIADQSFSEDFGTEDIDLSNVFSDGDGDNLSINASSSATSTVTVTVSGSTLTLTSVANASGSSVISVTANDGRGGQVSDEFVVEVTAVNDDPTVSQPVEDQDLLEGFGSAVIDIGQVFTDEDGEALVYGASSSNENVVTATIVEGSYLSLVEVGVGEATITVAAYDNNQASAMDAFMVFVSTCANDNSLNLVNTTCDNTPNVSNSYSELVSNGMRTITTNRVPDHDYGNQISNMGVNGLVSTIETFTFTANPTLASTTTNILDANNRPAYDYGIGLNGVPIDPAPAEPFIFENPNTGEYNWDWVFEPNNNRTAVGLDCNTAHLQPTDDPSKGLIHYHGDMRVYANSLYAGIGNETSPTVPNEPVQIGWASDGFPIVYKYGPTASGAGVEKLTSSYQLKSGYRGGDGTTAPCGAYNGKYTNDYAYVSGAGDLDECNGIARNITIGSETFSYFYVITDEFPIIGRCLSGTPAQDFSKMP